jgi:hypothetical protein
MTTHSGETFRNERVSLDENAYEQCDFVVCDLVYSGSGTVSLVGCSFRDCAFRFEGAAGNVVAFLNALAADPGLRSALPLIVPNLERRGRVN